MKNDVDSTDDFVVTPAGPYPSSREMFNNYINIKGLFDDPGVSKLELVQRGWINSKEDLTSFYSLLDIHRSSKSSRFYRRSDGANDAKCLIWLAKINQVAMGVFAGGRVPSFNGIDAEFLSTLAKMSVNENIPASIPDILAEIGIILIYEPGLSGMTLDGVVYRLDTGNPVIGLSFRYSRLDYFWFTLMHELAHICLHFEKLDEPIFDDLDVDESDLIETQANRLAKDSFVPRSIWRNCAPKYQTSEQVLIEFSEEIGIHPAIVAGMLRREKNLYTIYNRIVNKINVRDMVFGK